ncbi:MAG: sodium:proton antiporter, partial [Planctomycetes bacterium]|nr:sodium:proton antiporter [Planctomycetota bacterium]
MTFQFSTVSRRFATPSFIFFLLAAAAALWIGMRVPPSLSVEKITLNTTRDDEGQLSYTFKDKPKYIDEASCLPLKQAEKQIHTLADDEKLDWNEEGKKGKERYAYTMVGEEGDGQQTKLYHQLIAKRHWGPWSLLPALVAIALCWMTREPLVSLFGGIVIGAFLLGYYNLTDAVFVKNLATADAAGVLILYLWLLGGLLGVWSRTGAAQAFADLMTRKFVRGPKSAKLVAWCLGVIFFQGGTVSTVLVGTTVKPLADKENVSHEELAYIVDSTASPIASQLAFNAWPGYIQAFIFVAGVPFLATYADRMWFFFTSVPFCFYA